MHYIPRLLNEYRMFQSLNTFMTAKPGEKLNLKIEHFLYRASCVLTGLERMREAEGRAVGLVKNYIKQIKFSADKQIALSVEPLFEVYAQIPAVLSQIVNMQNQVLPILQGVFELNGSVPASLKDAIGKGIENYGFNSDTSAFINQYWNSNGQYIRDVRDVNEHFIALVDYTFFKYSKEPGQILILLPDNPETKSPNKFTYEKELDAFETLASGITQLNNLFETVLTKLGFNASQFTSSLYLGQMGSLVEHQERTLGLMISIVNVEASYEVRKLVLDTIEIQQIIPKSEGGGNLSVRKLKTDHELLDELKSA